MADYALQYRKFLVKEIAFEKDDLIPNQMLMFNYRGTQGWRIVLTVGEWPNNEKLHCLKLNEFNPITLGRQFREVWDNDVIDSYTKAIEYNVYLQRLHLNAYRLPIKSSWNPKVFYELHVKRMDKKTQSSYRTYNIDQIYNLRLCVPNLQMMGFLPKQVLINNDIPEYQKTEFLAEASKEDKERGRKNI